ncbi:polygalacturonase-like [Trifolium pratense]|uniref:polygalacturonase-like n=1 Tax=Trifolium pratense TaxID=57577 RepID=UPI001E694019|nr:polygalacturonase-like [Trifolium pratense]
MHVLALFMIFTSKLAIAIGETLNIENFGANPNGETDSTNAILTTWARACSSTTPTTIYVPKGKFLVSDSVVFKGSCNNNDITVNIDGTLLANSNYDVIGKEESWLLFEDVDGVSIIGNGFLDGQGTSLWDCKRSGESCPMGATNLRFRNSNNIVINGITSLNSQMFHIVIDKCNNVKIQEVKISAAGDSPNTDGIHVELSSSVNILNSNIATGDDCISIGPGTTNLWIEDIVCGPGHGISVGSLGKEFEELGVEHVTVKTVKFIGTTNGVRIKSWGKPSNGFARNILFQHVTMVNVQTPILIDQNYCPARKDCPNQASGIKISNIMYQNIHGTSATEVGVKFDCSPTNPCTGICLEDVMLTYENQHGEPLSLYNNALVQSNNCVVQPEPGEPTTSGVKHNQPCISKHTFLTSMRAAREFRLEDQVIQFLTSLINVAYDSRKSQDRGKGHASSFNGHGKKDCYCTYCNRRGHTIDT